MTPSEMRGVATGFRSVIHPPRHVQWGIILMSLVVITIIHNGVHLTSAPFVMILMQKLYFIPVILAGFWSGLRGGFFVAAIAALLYPHHGHMASMPGNHAMHGMQVQSDTAFFDAGQSSDMILLFIVAIMTGWLRNLLQQELIKHKKTAEQRDQALQETRRSFELVRRSEHLASLGQMAAGIAHEVRNPLTGMQGAVDILKRSGPEEHERRQLLLERLQTSIAHMDELTRHFLEFAKPPESDMQDVQPNLLITQAVQLLKPQAEKSGLQLHAEIPDSSRDSIHADREQIRQVLINLMLNAIQFANPGSTICITSRFEGGAWVAAVSNRGPEIPSSEWERIFDPFHTTRADGTGLGLAIVARIIEAHGGSIHCVSEEGVTTFELMIPGGEA